MGEWGGTDALPAGAEAQGGLRTVNNSIVRRNSEKVITCVASPNNSSTCLYSVQ